MTDLTSHSIAPIFIIDYGLGNLLSLQSALEKVGAPTVVSSNPVDITHAERIILPGVGSFGAASKSLFEGGFAEQIVAAVGQGAALLGICLGMQLLFDKGYENGVSPGLGLIRGSVRQILNEEGDNLPRTHVGWRDLDPVAINRGGAGGSFSKGPFYFVHSYSAIPEDASVIQAKVNYGSRDIPAIVQKANILGFQFHPEKSRTEGLALLRNFCLPTKQENKSVLRDSSA